MTTHEPAVSISRDIDAPAHEVFSYLARPAHHSTIDGSGMLRGTDDQTVLSGIGDVFEMKMFNDMLGEYVMENHVVEFEFDRRIAWEPVLKATDKPDFQSRVGDRAHLRWGWELTPQPGGERELRSSTTSRRLRSGYTKPPMKASSGDRPWRPAWRTWPTWSSELADARVGRSPLLLACLLQLWR